MIELHTTRAEEVHKNLASTGKYFNTGKVLMGVAYMPRPRGMSRDEEHIQRALLKRHGPRITAGSWGYLVFVIVLLGALFVAHNR